MEDYKFEITDIVYFLDEELPNYYRVIERKYYTNVLIKGNWYLIKEISNSQLVKQGWVQEAQLQLNIDVVTEY